VRALVKARPDLTLSDLGRELAGLAIKGWDQSQPFVGRQVSAPRGVDVQKTPNSSALTSRGPAPNGSFPPPYSPDMDPIEPLFGKVKQALRKIEKRTVDGLWDAVGVAIQDVSETERRNDFRNAGYGYA